MNALFGKVFLFAPFFHAERGVIHIESGYLRVFYKLGKKAGNREKKI